MKADDIAKELAERLRFGIYPKGSRFPSEYLLADEFSVNKTTANKAVSRLVEKGYLVRGKRGAGTFVSSNAVPTAKLIALVTPAPLDFFHARIVDGAQETALSRGYFLSVIIPPPSEMERYEETLRDSEHLGILSCSTEFRTEKPTVFVDYEYTGHLPGTDHVNTDNYEGGRMMMREVLAAGHRNIAVYCTQRLPLVRQRRIRGFLDEMLDAGFTNPEKRVYYGSMWSVDVAAENLRQMKNDIPKLSIIVCDSDDAVSVMLDAGTNLKIRIPGEIAITGFGNVIGNYGGIIRIANVEQFPDRLGAMACDKLISKIESGETSGSLQSLCRPTVVHPEYIPRIAKK